MQEDGEKRDAKDGEKRDAKKRLDMVRWMASYQYFAIAAEAAEVWTFAAAMAHLRICLQIGGAFHFPLGIVCLLTVAFASVSWGCSGRQALCVGTDLR